jgi:hypothetical protein
MRAASKTMSFACLYTFLYASLRTSCAPSYSFSYVPCTKLRPSDPLQLTPLTHSSVQFGTGPRCVASVAMQFVQWCSRPSPRDQEGARRCQFWNVFIYDWISEVVLSSVCSVWMVGGKSTVYVTPHWNPQCVLRWHSRQFVQLPCISQLDLRIWKYVSCGSLQIVVLGIVTEGRLIWTLAVGIIVTLAEVLINKAGGESFQDMLRRNIITYWALTFVWFGCVYLFRTKSYHLPITESVWLTYMKGIVRAVSSSAGMRYLADKTSSSYNIW